ncbi:unnamed protein product [Lampetra fluviatilis]
MSATPTTPARIPPPPPRSGDPDHSQGALPGLTSVTSDEPGHGRGRFHSLSFIRKKNCRRVSLFFMYGRPWRESTETRSQICEG